MIRHGKIWMGAAAAAFAWAALGSTSPARAAFPGSTAAIAAAATGQGNDFWEDRFNAMRRIWGTPYVPLGYYWDQARGLPPRPAPVAPGVYSDRPIYPYGGYGYGGRRVGGYGYAPGYGYGYGYGYGPSYGYASGPWYGPSYGYGPGYGYGSGFGIQLNLGPRVYPAYGSPYGGFYGW